MSDSPDSDLKGWLNALFAFGWWGFVFPSILLLLKSVTDESVNSTLRWSLEILAHRIVLSLIFCIVLLVVLRRLSNWRDVFRNKSHLGWFAVSAFLIFLNWLGFIVGASTGKLSQTSLGYYMGPLFNVALGYVFFSERLRGLQMVAVGLAFGGVAWLTVIQGEFPWISICLASSFGLYGYVRKKIPVDSIVGLTMECLFCLPLALGLLIWFSLDGTGLHVFEANWKVNSILLIMGPVTAAPLICFAIAARRLRLGTLGFIQFIAPTGQLLLAMFVDQESIPPEKLVGYSFVWLAVGVYLVDLGRGRRRSTPAAPLAETGDSDVPEKRTKSD